MSNLQLTALLRQIEAVAPVRDNQAYTMESITRLLGYGGEPETLLLPVEPHSTEQEID